MGETDECAGTKGQMLPGIAAICLYMILMTTVNVYAALHGAFGTGAAKTGILTLCTLLAAGIFGLLRLRKWGWALVTAGCLLFAAGDFSTSRRFIRRSFWCAGCLCWRSFSTWCDRRRASGCIRGCAEGCVVRRRLRETIQFSQ